MSVFISYCQQPPENKIKVQNLVEQLEQDEIEVIIDYKHLKPGHDMFVFMERMINDPNVTHVLIICNKEYACKVDQRKGGVGTEALIYTPELYEKPIQDKFIPIVFEKDENGKAYLPVSLKSRYYIDMSNETVSLEYYNTLISTIKVNHNSDENTQPELDSNDANNANELYHNEYKYFLFNQQQNNSNNNENADSEKSLNDEIHNYDYFEKYGSINGKHFSINLPNAIKTFIFIVNKKYDENDMCLYYGIKEMDSIEQEADKGIKNNIFFIDDNILGQPIAIISILQNKSISMTNGILDDDKVKISKAPMYYEMSNVFTTDNLPENFDVESINHETKEFSLNIDFSKCKSFIIIDVDNCKTVKPIVYFDEFSKTTKYKIYLHPHKPYFWFSILPEDDVFESISYSDLGRAYFSGDFGMKKDYAKSAYYLSLVTDEDKESIYNTLAIMCLKGLGVPKDVNKALDNFSKCDTLSPDDAYYYAYALELTKEYEDALWFYRKAMKKGSQLAAFRLYELYTLGYIVKRNKGVAKRYRNKLVDNECDKQMLRKACELYFENQIDDDEAIIFFEMSAKLGNRNAQYMLGYIYCKDNKFCNYDKAIDWLTEAAYQNHHYAFEELGDIYYNGLGVDIDYKEAAKWYELASKSNILRCTNRLANMYIDGLGIDIDENKAFDLWKYASDLGNHTATNNLGWMYYKGIGVEQDYKKAFQLFSKAVKIGSTKSKLWLGRMYRDGNYVNKNLSKAIEWFIKAEDEEDSLAAYELGIMYENSTDLDLAIYHYQKAYELGELKAKAKLDILSNKMNDIKN